MAVKHHDSKSEHAATGKGGTHHGGSTHASEHGHAHHGNKTKNKVNVHAPTRGVRAAKNAIHTAHPKVNHSRKKGGHRAEQETKDHHHVNIN